MLHMVLYVASIDEEIRVFALKVFFSFVVSLEGVLKLVELLEVGYKVAKVGVSQEIPGSWVFQI